MPNRRGADATTTVRPGTDFWAASMCLSRISAWRLSQDCATNTASSPNTTAKAIITMVLVRTALLSGTRLHPLVAA